MGLKRDTDCSSQTESLIVHLRLQTAAVKAQVCVGGRSEA